MSTNQLYLKFMIEVLEVYEIFQENSHYILYVKSLIVLSSMHNQASALSSAKSALYSLEWPWVGYPLYDTVKIPKWVVPTPRKMGVLTLKMGTTHFSHFCWGEYYPFWYFYHT